MLQALADKSSLLHAHLISLSPDPDAYLSPIFTSLFTGSLAVDEAARLWDVYVFEGDTVLIRAAVALLLEEEGVTMAAKSVEEVRGVLLGGKRGRAVGDAGAEERWMGAVRAAGK